jgi:glucose-1-phosphate thymidylyltransferase|tara:strand:+ start:1086 stop:1952 length:867 start_codon:yes stop_codon:yes gene_type:complete
MKGILLAGGFGSRLKPLTSAFSKQLLPIFDKPMIYYPLSVLMLAGIKEILIITTERDSSLFKTLLGDGSDFGISIEYLVQANPDGIGEAFILGEEFIGNSDVTLILGDNIFYGHQLSEILLNQVQNTAGATIFTTIVDTPNAFAVAEIDAHGQVISLEEKPAHPKSNNVATGLYFYSNDVIEVAKNIQPSARGELEITDINKEYLRQGELNAVELGRGFAWLDTGTQESLLEAANFIETIQHSQGLMVACLEEIAYRSNWIDDSQLSSAIEKYNNSPYGEYLRKVLQS